jgi:eukaryotic-like serine/threonine-protein kinase
VDPPIDVFISYAPEDEPLRKELVDHLATMMREGLIRAWDQRQVAAGDAYRATVERHLTTASVVVLLASPSYVCSNDIYAVEMAPALERARAGTVRVIPVIVRPVDLGTLFAGLRVLPRNERAVTTWPNRDEAWREVALGIREAVGLVPAVDADPPRNHQNACEPVYEDALSRALAEELERARYRCTALRAAGSSTVHVEREILELRRQLREGGRLRPGDELEDGRYLLLEHIGRGGFASIWKARDRKHDILVAIKVMHPDQAREASRRERFFRGARVMAELKHQAVVSVLEDHGEDGKYLYFVMELVDGPDLHRVVRERRLALEDVVPLILRIGEALAEAHAKGFVHRDVKPANILLDKLGRPRLTDFDLVAAWDTTGATRTGGMGSVPFTAPEQLHNAKDADARADVYSLGMTAIFCLHGGDLPASFMRRPEEVIRALQCGRAMRRVLTRAIEVEPDARHRDAGAFCEALEIASIASAAIPDDTAPIASAAIPDDTAPIAAAPIPDDTEAFWEAVVPGTGVAYWQRRGREVQREDWDSGNCDLLTKDEAAEILVSYFDDLPDDENDRKAALAWAADAYADDLRKMHEEKLRNDGRKDGQVDTLVRYLEKQLGRDLFASERWTVALRYDTLGEGRIVSELFALLPAELADWLEGSHA